MEGVTADDRTERTASLHGRMLQLQAERYQDQAFRHMQINRDIRDDTCRTNMFFFKTICQCGYSVTAREDKIPHNTISTGSSAAPYASADAIKMTIFFERRTP
jgi:hypothetical protein